MFFLDMRNHATVMKDVHNAESSTLQCGILRIVDGRHHCSMIY